MQSIYISKLMELAEKSRADEDYIRFQLEQLEEAGIQEGDTVRMYGLQFDYYK